MAEASGFDLGFEDFGLRVQGFIYKGFRIRSHVLESAESLQNPGCGLVLKLLVAFRLLNISHKKQLLRGLWVNLQKPSNFGIQA